MTPREPPTPPSPYIGRYAPSPSGPLHFGSLAAAVASFAEARHAGGAWHVRVEDVDTPRVVPGAADGILRTLEACGMAWDGEVMYQSRRGEAYEAAIETLRARRPLYACICSRREIADSALTGIDGPVYPGTCREARHAQPGRACRIDTRGVRIAFEDGVQGAQSQDVAGEVGDFVLRRADGIYAYQLAVVVDDGAQGVTHVVRGADLLDSTPRQIWLQQQLGLPIPRYAHVSVAVTAAGEKLAKQTGAPPVDALPPARALCAALDFLGQQPPTELTSADVATVWAWALAHWDTARVPRVRSRPAPL